MGFSNSEKLRAELIVIGESGADILRLPRGNSTVDNPQGEYISLTAYLHTINYLS